MGSTFKNRLKILMEGEKPYTWAKKVGIEKGLFQYYWQKNKIPTYVNLVKIQNHTGCSIEWLLTGQSPIPGQITNLAFMKTPDPVLGDSLIRISNAMDIVNDVYASKDKDDIELLENAIRVIKK